MSYDINVNVSRWPADVLPKWRAELKRMGLDVEFHPDFDPRPLQGWLPLKVTVEDDESEIPLADERFELALFESGFEYYADETGALFSAKAFAGNAVAFWCAAALAAVSAGTLYDPQIPLTVSGSSGREILDALAAEARFWASLCGPEIVTP